MTPPICSTCGRDVCNPCTFRPANDNKRVVTVARDDELLRRSHFQRLGTATRALNLSRREIPNWMADVIFGFKGKIVWPGGMEFRVHDEAIDQAFGDDGSFRWLSAFMLFGERELRQSPQFRTLHRLRLIDLAFRIAYPERAAFIAR